MKQLKDRIISAAILFSVILTGVCVVWWGYASQYQKILGTSPSSPMLQKPSSALVFAVLTAGLTAGIFVFLFRKKLPFFKLRTVSAMILILLLFVKIMKIWANDRDLTFALALLSPFSMKFMASRNWLWTDVSVAFCLTWTLCGILLFVLLGPQTSPLDLDSGSHDDFSECVCDRHNPWRTTFFISLCSGNSDLVIHRGTGNSGAAKMD